ncbi:MAG: hypothetical protein ACJ790_02165 [Myxococcaceae bacterium]
MRSALAIGLFGLLLTGCPSNQTPADSGVSEVPDSGPAPVACSKPEDCRSAGLSGVCRGGFCSQTIPCAEDLECGLGESCQSGSCRFTGCTKDSECPTGKCRADVYACAQCGSDADCPADHPVCNATGACVQCASDDQCAPPGPGYCDPTSGSCVHCRTNAHCPTGLSCGLNGVCKGAGEGQTCSAAVSCDQGLICVNVGGASTKCLRSCNLYTPNCATDELCLKLTFSDTASLVFESGAPLGVCSQPFNGLKFYKENCSNNNCQPNLQCVPDNAQSSSCKAFCDPSAPSCATGETCHPYPGDFNGRQYGLCYPNNGYGDVCTAESACKPGLSCAPFVDPSTFSEVSTACRFGGDAGVAYAPCTADTQCRSGLCANDLSLGANKLFCFAACSTDTDCTVGGRQGFCDNASDVTIPPYSPTTISGCKPACDDAAQCAAYASGMLCRLRVTSEAGVAKALRTCQLPIGSNEIGASCISDSDCKAGFCNRRDSRGAFRPGICTAPCASAGDCVTSLSDGGSLSLPSCTVTAFNVNAGVDGVLNTVDDRDVSAKVCAPPSCAQASDCPPNFPLCTVDSDPSATSSSFVLRCRSAAFGSKIGGDPCTSDGECQSNACAELLPPSPGTGRVCLEPCVEGQTTCATNLTCRANAARLLAKDGSAVTFTACVP